MCWEWHPDFLQTGSTGGGVPDRREGVPLLQTGVKAGAVSRLEEGEMNSTYSS